MLNKIKDSGVHHHVVHWVALASVLGHVFCCGLPLVVGLLSLLSGLGMLSILMPGLNVLHDTLHHYEIPLVIFSVFMVVMGWALYLHSRKVDCHTSGCHHPPCETRKTKTSWLLWVATAICLLNLVTVAMFHARSGQHQDAQHQAQEEGLYD